MKRRDFLKVAPTVGAASLILDGCGKPEKLIPLLLAPDEFVPGEEGRVKAVMAKKIEGNPDHPVSMGGTCARGQASVQALYHPDRIQGPLKLSGARGSGQYQPITWKE